MTYTYWQIERYERTGDNVWSSTASNITDLYDPVVRMSIGEGKDTFEFKLQNFAGEWDGQSIDGGSGFNVGDKIKVYYKVNSSSVDSSDLLLQGIVTDIPYEVDGKNNFIRIKGNNYSETLMSALVFYAPPTGGLPLNEYLESALNSIALFNDDFKVTWNAGNPSVRSNGSAFANITEKWFYKSALKLIEAYSGEEKTGDGNYYWFVDEDNSLVWRRKTDSVDFNFNTSSNEYKALKVKKDTKGIVNFVIAKGGVDVRGDSVTVKRDDPVSRAKHGFKYKLLTLDAETSQKMQDQDKLAAGIDADEPISSSNYPAVTGWVSEITNTTVASSSWSDYADNFREEIKYRLTEDAKAYILQHRYGKLQVELEFTNGKGWGLGNVVRVTIPEITATNKPMRVVDIEYTEDSERYVLEEDEGTI